MGLDELTVLDGLVDRARGFAAAGLLRPIDGRLTATLAGRAVLDRLTLELAA